MLTYSSDTEKMSSLIGRTFAGKRSLRQADSCARDQRERTLSGVHIPMAFAWGRSLLRHFEDLVMRADPLAHLDPDELAGHRLLERLVL